MKHPDFNTNDYPDPTLRNKAKAEYYEYLIKKYEKQIGFPFENIYCCVAERDCFDPLKSSGALLFETYTGKATMQNAIERAETLGDRYGKVFICRVEPVGDVEFCRDIVENWP